MEELTAYRQALLSSLMSVVGELSQIVTAIRPNALQVPSGPDARSPHFNLALLRELENQVFIPNLQRIQMEEIPLLPVLDDQAWMAAHCQPDEPLQKIMEKIVRERAQEITWLKNLPP